MDRLRVVLAKIDAANAEDPNREFADGKERPKELLYAERMTRWLERLEPSASEAVRLAVRAQHIRRWTIPRSRYPTGKKGYLDWRTTLYGFHAEKAGAILREAGYDEGTIERVKALVRKDRIKTDPEGQLLEDVAALVFLEFYFADFARQQDEGKLVTIVRKTWHKMSERGRKAALGIPFSPSLKALVLKAVSPTSRKAD